MEDPAVTICRGPWRRPSPSSWTGLANRERGHSNTNSLAAVRSS